MTLKELSVDHDYYCHESNFYSNQPRQNFIWWSEFYEEYGDADIDMNLIFRWDLKEYEDSNDEKTGLLYLEIFMIQQRKGIFKPIKIDNFREQDIPTFLELVSKHWEKLQSIWNPISSIKV